MNPEPQTEFDPAHRAQEASDAREASDASRLRRLHPLTPFLEVPTLLLKWVGPFVVIGFASSKSNAFFSQVFIYAAIGAGIALAQSLVRYFTLRYGIDGERMLMTSGLVFRRHRVIPLEQVQNVDIRQKPLQRVFGLCEVRIETAGGNQTEARLAVVSRKVAHEFKDELLSRRSRTRSRSMDVSESAEADAEVVIRNVTLGELLLLGATENRVGPIVGGLFALSELAEDTGFDVRAIVTDSVDRLVGSGPFATAIAVVASIFLLIIGGWFVSIALTFMTYFGFSLRRTSDGLRRSHGLFSRFEALIHLRRIQVILTDANPLRRLAGYVSVRVQTAGSLQDSKSAGSAMLFPMLAKHETADLIRLIFPTFAASETQLRPVHRLSLRRGFIRYMLFFSIALGILMAGVDWRWLAALPVGVLFAYLLARARYRSLGWVLSQNFLLTRAGIWTRRLWVVPTSRVQSVALQQSPFQRRLGLATVVVATAGAASWSATRVIDLGLADAEGLFDRLVAGAARSSWDGGFSRGRRVRLAAMAS